MSEQFDDFVAQWRDIMKSVKEVTGENKKLKLKKNI